MELRLGRRPPAGEPHRASFEAYVAHELRTPLATQRALLEVALADSNTDEAAWRGIGENLLRACRQQERLIEACLTLATSRGALRRSVPVDLAATAAGALRAQHLGDLEPVVMLEQAWTRGDPGLVECLVANLVSNAIRHNIVRGRIEIRTQTKSGRAVLSVANTGALVPRGDIRRLFEPFYRPARSRSLVDGAGLGLAIVHAVANAHDAPATARPRTGGGLVVSVAFPALD